MDSDSEIGVTELQTTASGVASIAEKFFKRFSKGGKNTYFEKLEQMPSKQYPVLLVDYIDLDTMITQDAPDSAEYSFLINLLQLRPHEAMTALVEGAWSILNDIHPAYALEVKNNLTIRLKNITTELEIPQIRAEHVGSLAALTGIVSMMEQPSTLITKPVYYCQECGAELEGAQTRGLEYTPLSKCLQCKSPKIQLDMQKCEKTTYQRINIQQLHEKVEPGSIASDIEGWIFGDDLMNQINPGERIRVIGFISLKQRKPKGANAWFDFYMDVNNVINLYEEDIIEEDVSEKEILMAIDPKSEDTGFYKLILSISPSIKGLEEIKTACLLQAASSEAQTLPDDSRLRGDINILLIGDPGCIRYSSRIALGDGKIVKLGTIADTHLQNINIPVLTGKGNRRRDVATRFHIYRHQPIIEIITESGKQIAGTHNHPILTTDGRSQTWKRLDEMRLGDRLQVVTRIPSTIVSPVKTGWSVSKELEYLDKELAAIMGWLTGDGWARKYSIGFGVPDHEKELLEPLLQMFKNKFGGVANTPYIRTEKLGTIGIIEGRQFVRTMNMTQVVYNSIRMVEILSFLKDKQPKRHLPELIFLSPDSVVASFLKWLFEADGSVFNNGRGRRAVQLKSSSIEMLREVQLLLLRFGIHSRIVGNNLGIKRGESILKYAEYIGFASIRKNTILAALAKDAHNFKRFGSQRSERVVKINHLPPEDVYDIEVPKSHRFIANGIISHNSAKSTILKFMAKTQKRAHYAAGKGNSKAGLTASVIRESNNTMPRLEAGLYLICDRGLACVDEIDKITPDDKEALPTLMDDVQVLPIHKFGINKEIPCRAASLHACNPVGGKWDESKTLVENVEFAHWLFDRYDLKFVLRNQPEEVKDNETSKHFAKMLNLSTSEKDVERKKKDAHINLPKEYHSLKFMKAWISYVRRNYNPEVPQEVMENMRQFYVLMRKKDTTKDITMREMGTLYRLARASARAHMRNVVTDKDVEIGKNLIIKALVSCGLDPQTGKVDFSLTQSKTEDDTGVKTRMFKRAMNILLSDTDRAHYNTICDQMKVCGYNQAVVSQMIGKFHRAGWIYEIAQNTWAKTPDWGKGE